MGSTATRTDIDYNSPQTRYQDPLPLAKALWDRVGPRAADLARARAFECNSVADRSGALLWEDVGRLLVRGHALMAHPSRRLRFGEAV